jgi:hypothetical protein
MSKQNAIAIEAVCISRVPPEKSKDTQHQQRAPKLNLNERCNFTTTMPAQQRKQPQPSVSDDTKYLRWKVQQRGFKPKYFSYRRQDTREAEQQARAWRFEDRSDPTVWTDLGLMAPRKLLKRNTDVERHIVWCAIVCICNETS